MWIGRVRGLTGKAAGVEERKRQPKILRIRFPYDRDAIAGRTAAAGIFINLFPIFGFPTNRFFVGHRQCGVNDLRERRVFCGTPD